MFAFAVLQARKLAAQRRKVALDHRGVAVSCAGAGCDRRGHGLRPARSRSPRRCMNGPFYFLFQATSIFLGAGHQPGVSDSAYTRRPGEDRAEARILAGDDPRRFRCCCCWSSCPASACTVKGARRWINLSAWPDFQAVEAGQAVPDRLPGRLFRAPPVRGLQAQPDGA
jgi:hypothetical protein